MKHSVLPLTRKIFHVFKKLAMVPFYACPHPGVSSGLAQFAAWNPTWDLLGYPGPNIPDRPLDASTFQPPTRFLEFDVGNPENLVELEADVVIVGSGCGGGIIAAQLAQAGHRVVVLEKGSYVHPTKLSLVEGESLQQFCENAVLCQSEDGSITIVAGSTWGGGSRINWSASLVPPKHLLEEWSERFHLPHLLTNEFQQGIDTVLERMGVGIDSIQHNSGNQILLDGCRRLGYHCDSIPQNTGHKPHSCGSCFFGCPSETKQSSDASWLRDAERHGARFVQSCFVERVLIENGKAVGVSGWLHSGQTQLRVKAKHVVSSCGSIHTPALLLRSGLKNRHIGSKLHLHPVHAVVGVFPEPVKMFEGSIMTALSNQIADRDGKHYGAKLEVPASHTSIASLGCPWNGPLDSKLGMLRFPNMSSMIVLARDKDSQGSVSLDTDGNPVIRYRLGRFDSDTLAMGVQTSAEVLLAAGAREILIDQTGTSPYRVEGDGPIDVQAEIGSERFRAWTRQVHARGFRNLNGSLLSAHQMGSCVMAGRPDLGAVQPTGETWEVQNLWVGDTSLFPTASGVNPMITVYSMAFSVAQAMKQRMGEQAKL
ncbi:GMC oxidoreductase-domain-containing protein [Polychytrium aggregatum]|uniref:GMC oxidoreductase-domain-containing protein n=1 Tax=Polychytrium aggregatum TaxID=110093 RepID=UPI0022FE27D5|nr:GMC oxidoreductase-domain-containing protein [Polychytrium aggregatum]KAI9202823.1 GMC oxidoreductase-domain-containing protein [Polychytrium aggregatum]